MAPYRETVMADRPSAYWRLGDATVTDGASAKSEAGPNGVYHASGITSIASGLARTADKAVTLNGSTNYISVPVTNLVTNPSFETNLSGWTQYFAAGGSIARIATDAAPGYGSACAELTFAGADMGMYQVVSGLTPGDDYTLSVWLKRANGSAGLIHFLFQDGDFGTWRIDLQSTGTGGAWTRYSGTAKATSSSMIVWIFVSNSPAGTARIDGISLTTGALDLGDVFSIEFWIKRTATINAFQGIIDKGDPAFDVYWTDTNKLALMKRTGTDIAFSSASVTDTNWHHAVVTKNGATTKWYIDGIEGTTAGTPQTLTNGPNEMTIGRDTAGIFPMPGSIDEVALYKYALSASQVKAHYEAGTVTGTKADLVVQIYFAQEPTAAVDAPPENVTEFVREFEISRGRSYELDRFEAGTLSMTLKNPDGRFDPMKASWPYYPYVRPMKKVRVSADWGKARYDLFTGYIEQWPCTWEANLGYGEVTINATDALGLLQRMRFPAATIFDNFGTFDCLNGTFTDGSDLTGVGAGYCKSFYAEVTSQIGGTDANLSLVYRDISSFSTTTLTGVTNIATTLVNVSGANFTQADLFSHISGTGIPAGSYITKIENTAAVLINQNCTAQGSASITWGGYKLYPATVTLPAGSIVGTKIDIPVYPNTRSQIDDVVSMTIEGTVTGTCTIKGIREMFAQETSGVQVVAMLDKIGWPGTGSAGGIHRDINTGQSTILGSTPEHEAALPWLQAVADGEMGAFFASPSGQLTFRQRNARWNSPYGSSYATFGDAGAELDYVGLTPDYSADRIYNEVTATRPETGAVSQTVADTTSQTRYMYRPVSVTPPVTTDGEALSMATYLLSILKDPKLTFRSLTVVPEADPANLWPHALGRALMERITVKARPPGVGVITQECHIEAIQHSGSPADWRTTWQLSPVVSAPGY